MSNETKREVFEAVWNRLAGYQVFFNGWPKETLDGYKKRYDNALPDDLPLIPKAVAYAIEWFQQNDETIGEVWRNLYEDVDDDWQEAPKLREAEEWMLDNQDTFTTAWLLGAWNVDKPNKL